MKILVPTDFSENAHNAYEFAREIALIQNASITLLYAFYAVYDFATRSEEILDSIERDAKKQLKLAVQLGTDLGLKVDYLLIQGTVATTVTATAYRKDYDLIVMGTQGASGIKKALIGSNTGHVLKESQVSVLVIPQSAKWENVRKISCAIDMQKEEKIFYSRLFKLTQKMNLPFEFVHFEQTNDFSKDIIWRGLQSYFKEILPDHSISFKKEPSQDFEKGVEKYLEISPDALMVMFYRDKTFFEYLFNKSQSLQLAYHTHVPLLVVK